MAISVTPLGPALGAEIRGVDLATRASDDTFREILEAWYRHLVLVFPDQHITNEQHIAFSRRFGPLEIHPSRHHTLKDHPEILLLTNRKDASGKYISLRDGGSVWHSDLSYMQYPSLGSLLYALDVPKDGGDTEWSNMYLAYESLPEATRGRIAGLKAVHQFDAEANPRMPRPPADPEKVQGSIYEKKSAEIKARTPDAVHPIVRVHPATGRKALFVSRRFTIRVENMNPDEGESLLLDLFDHAERPEHIYRHRWKPHQLIMWDNRCTTHLACGGVPDSQIRTMQRTTIRGELPA